jgi:hypothetical protein
MVTGPLKMPFTLSHPAASVPLSKKGLCLSALIIGSMVPDFDNLIPDLPDWMSMHHFLGLFISDLPIGFILLFLFHKVLKEAALPLLPEDHRARLAALAGEFKFYPIRRLGWILFSLLVGSMTHLFWDSFTHANGMFVQLIPALAFSIYGTGRHAVAVFGVLQLLSTLIGAALLILWYFQWYRKAVIKSEQPVLFLTPPLRFGIVILMLALALAGGLGITFIYAPLSNGLIDPYLITRAVVVSGMVLLLAEWLVWGGIYRWIIRR